MTIPLYKHELQREFPGGGNTGLWFDKFCCKWRKEEVLGQKRWTLKTQQQRGKKTNAKDEKTNPKLEWIKTVTKKDVGDETFLTEMYKRQKALLAHAGTSPLPYRTQGPFVTGLGRPHPVENGFCWHHTLGVPYLPGSSVKGLVRNWIEEWGDKEQRARLLPCCGGERRAKEDDGELRAGDAVFLDALPIEPPTLGVDILTPHMGRWYQEGGSLKDMDEAGIIPGDWHDPVPAPFLVVEDALFSFGILPRRPSCDAHIEDLKKCMEKALKYLGAGAKTAVGYGRMAPDEAEQKKLARERLSPDERLRQEIKGYSDKILAKKLGRDFNKTKELYGQEGKWPFFLRIVEEYHGEKLRSWADEDKKSNRRKAYKKFHAAMQELQEREEGE